MDVNLHIKCYLWCHRMWFRWFCNAPFFNSILFQKREKTLWFCNTYRNSACFPFPSNFEMPIRLQLRCHSNLVWSLRLMVLQINADGVTRNFYTGDSLPSWHEELEPRDSLLDILSSSSAEPMSTWAHGLTVLLSCPAWLFHI